MVSEDRDHAFAESCCRVRATRFCGRVVQACLSTDNGRIDRSVVAVPHFKQPVDAHGKPVPMASGIDQADKANAQGVSPQV